MFICPLEASFLEDILVYPPFGSAISSRCINFCLSTFLQSAFSFAYPSFGSIISSKYIYICLSTLWKRHFFKVNLHLFNHPLEASFLQDSFSLSIHPLEASFLQGAFTFVCQTAESIIYSRYIYVSVYEVSTSCNFSRTFMFICLLEASYLNKTNVYLPLFSKVYVFIYPFPIFICLCVQWKH